MGFNLQQILRGLCVGKEWNYAVFWKLKHLARMELTWEDGYYDTCKPNNTSETPIDLQGGHYSLDLLGLAVAKMSYHVYSLGEGIVGQVAVYGQHRWILAENVNGSGSSFEIKDGLQSQISAGIKTIVVVAVGPHGVVELGSLKNLHEDVKLVTRIRDLFSAFQDSSLENVTNAMLYSVRDSQRKGLVLEVSSDCIRNVYKGPDVWLPVFPDTRQTESPLHAFPLPNIDQTKVVEVVKNHDEGCKFWSGNNVVVLEHQDQVTNMLYAAEMSGCKGLNAAKHEFAPDLRDSIVYDRIIKEFTSEAETLMLTRGSSYLFDSAVCNALKLDCTYSYERKGSHLSESSGKQCHKGSEKLESQIQSSHTGALNSSSKFFTGCELLEALGPAFLQKSNYVDQEAQNIDEPVKTIQITEEISCSQLTFDSGAENLLEAIVATAFQAASGVESERSVQSLTADKMVEPSSHAKHTINSAGCSNNWPSLTEGDIQQNASEVSGARSSRRYSSTYPSKSTGQSEKAMEPPKSNRRRVKPGENGRPRPRDRQLIQDRLKELRELVPNGSKCSIDSLLEHTIKHMTFLQSITKHAENLSNCVQSKVHRKGPGVQGTSNCEQGSSWAVEVGGHLRVCSILVENLSKHGQILVEMLCEECCHFLEIAEAIRSLGLTILKGVTEAHGEKTWICFVVEGQKEEEMHRMDILWSLVQIFQPKTG